MSDESIHDKKERIRKPRVHIKYTVTTDGAKVVKSLPFVLGVAGDFSGDPTGKLEDLENREFIEIDRDNFDDILARMKPGLTLQVKDTLEGGSKEFGVKLKFNKMKDFEPAQIVEQVEPLRNLMMVRNQIKELQSRVENSAQLERMMEKILSVTANTRNIAGELGLDTGAESPKP